MRTLQSRRGFDSNFGHFKGTKRKPELFQNSFLIIWAISKIDLFIKNYLFIFDKWLIYGTTAKVGTHPIGLDVVVSWLTPNVSVTRCGEVLPLWPNLKSWATFLAGLLSVWQNFEPALAIFCYQADFKCCMWQNYLSIWSHCRSCTFTLVHVKRE